MLLEAGLAGLILGSSGCLGWLGWEMHRRNMTRWLGSYVRDLPRRRLPRKGEPVHLLLCIADHFEPNFSEAGGEGGNRITPEIAHRRVQHWLREFPRLARFRDSDGYPPQHTFFYPAEEYVPEHLHLLSELCQAGFAEVEIHLHHDRDTAAGLRHTLTAFRDTLAQRHGLLARRPDGQVAYAFIHGNWALCNSRPDGRWCGVNEEIEVLQETGCYLDLTLPSAPSATQTRTINRIYYAVNQPGRARSHESGVEVGYGQCPENGLMLLQGPLILDWKSRKWGLLPRLENGVIQKVRPAHPERIPLWLRARVQVPTRPDWFFVKLHAHGGPERDHEALLGSSIVHFHETLAERATRDPQFHYHYLTAREMYNLVRAAESGWTGTVAKARNFELIPGPQIRRPA